MAELEKGSIAYELSELAKARDEIVGALSAALTGTNKEGAEYTLPFIEYGNLIKVLTAINHKKGTKADSLDLNDLYSQNRFVVYYISSDTYGNVLNHPTKDIGDNFWLLSLDEGTVKTQIAWVRDDNQCHLYIRHDAKDWVEFPTLATVETKISEVNVKKEVEDLKEIVSVINPTNVSAKPGDIKVEGSNIYICDGNKKWQLMNSWQ